MSASVLPSTFVLTLLMLIGLLFFIKASVKERIEVVRLSSEQPELSLLNQLQAYFTQRAYQVVATDAANLQLTFEGFVRPSLVLALFLTLLAAIGLLCLSLTLSYLFSGFSTLLLTLPLLSPIAGVFYWRKSARQEQVLLKVESNDASGLRSASVITVTAHRDELAALQRHLPLKRL
ncbi:MAG: cofactor assembly of complex C subunit B [Stenomitos frigidus ULC029]